MPKPNDAAWNRYCQWLFRNESLGFTLDVSRIRFTEGLFDRLKPEISRAWRDLRDLEAGKIVNRDEKRQVGHYWLRTPALAPKPEIAEYITRTVKEIEAFTAKVRAGKIAAPSGKPFRHALLIGIGGSALGPQLVADALRQPGDPIDLHFLDNTDPAGIDRVVADLGNALAETLVIVTSKSGGTPETRNGMLEIEAAFTRAGLSFARQAVAITMTSGSSLFDKAKTDKWLKIFEMADWIGGRTSVLSAVGLLPARLIGVDIASMLAGASEMDALTRLKDARKNPAMLLALMWHHAGGGKGKKDMVILPYCDRLSLFGKYLQQLIMESLGKALDRQGRRVNQGIAVYGNKGSTDQHAYIQQLRDGLNNFFATFIEIRQRGADGNSMTVDETLGATTGDFLQGFLRGTRDALDGNGRESITVSFGEMNARSLGALIALFERAVSFYASLVDINAYHQPGVEAGKKAAGEFLKVVAAVSQTLSQHSGKPFDVSAIRNEVAKTLPGTSVESVYHAANHLAATRPGLTVKRGDSPAEDRFSASSGS